MLIGGFEHDGSRERETNTIHAQLLYGVHTCTLTSAQVYTGICRDKKNCLLLVT